MGYISVLFLDNEGKQEKEKGKESMWSFPTFDMKKKKTRKEKIWWNSLKYFLSI